MDAHLPTDRQTGRPRGFAFVRFASEAEAAEAIRRFHGREVDGRKLNVNAAEDRPSRPAGAPPYQASSMPADYRGFPGDAGPSGARPKPFRAKGSRRGLRRRKRSL